MLSQYSIRDLENYTQIKAHTLRIWEQRYAILRPKRTDNNIRYYSEKDLKKILNVNVLYSNGLKISKIAKLKEDEIIERVKSIMDEESADENPNINAFILAISGMNAQKICSLLDSLYAEMGLQDLYGKILVPLFVKMGKLWQVNTFNIGHEHIFSSLLRDFFILKTFELKPRERENTKVLFFLPDHEEHELSLLFYRYILRSKGVQCYYLGTSIPAQDLRKTVEQVHPQFLITNLIARVKDSKVKRLFEEIEDFFDLSHVKVGGNQAYAFKSILPENIQLFDDAQGLLRGIHNENG